jgi:hypothetical protein
MKRIKLFRMLPGVALCMAMPLALAGEDVDQTQDASSDGLVEVDNIRGEIVISGWDKNQIRVVGELDDLAEGLEFTVTDKVTLIRVKMPDRDIHRGDGSDLEIHIPRGSRVDFGGVSTDVELDNIRGGIDVRSVSGDIEASGIAGKIYVKSISGDIDIEDSEGATTIKSVSGDTRAVIATRVFTFSGVSGDADLELGALETLNVNSVNGDIDIGAGLLDQGRIELKTVNGDCRLALKGDINARVQIVTGPGGDIYNDLDDTEPEEVFPASSRLSTTLGDGSGSIRAKTVNGDIRMERE